MCLKLLAADNSTNIGNLSATPDSCMYSDPSVYERSVYKFSHIWDGQIGNCCSICNAMFAYASSFLSHTDCCSRCHFVAITASQILSVQNIMAFLSSGCRSSSIAAYFIVLVALLWGSLFSVLSHFATD
jgi:hypothetical protein